MAFAACPDTVQEDAGLRRLGVMDVRDRRVIGLGHYFSASVMRRLIFDVSRN